MTSVKEDTTATGIASAVRYGRLSARQLVTDTLTRIERLNPRLNCYAAVVADRALARAERVDSDVAAGGDPGPLAGVPFAVKNLFDIQGITTLAGSRINADDPPAATDAVLVSRLESAGAILVGSLAMGEYAYDFTGENQHYGPCRNPWDSDRMSGGSSSGSGAATAAGLAPLSLGSDTNGSIRVPASLCGIFGLKPTYGRLPRTGTYPFCDSLDHVGPLARSAADLALAFDCLQGTDPGDTACADRPPLATGPELAREREDLRLARAGGFFDCGDYPEADAAVDRVCEALAVERTLSLDGAAEGRAAAYLITNAESSVLHRPRIRDRLADFDNDTRDRFLAGSLLPASWYVRAQAVRRWWHDRMLELFREVDALIAPATPCSAPLLGTRTLKVGGEEQLLRPNLGLFTQPFSAIGLPVCTVPVWNHGAELPIGVQIVAPPWREDICLRIAHRLECLGTAQSRMPPL